MNSAFEKIEPHAETYVEAHIPPTNPPKKINKNFAYYLIFCRFSCEPTDLYNLQLAYATGYVSALHKSHTYSPCLVPIHQVGEHSGWLFEKIRKEVHDNLYPDVDPKLRLLSLDCSSEADLGIDQYSDSNYSYIIESALCTDFVSGYMDALQVARKYDHVFHYSAGSRGISFNDDVINCIFCDLSAENQRTEDSTRNFARICRAAANGNRSKLRAMVFDVPSLDDNGEPVPPQQS